MGTASSADIDRLLRERVDDKVEKARGFHFEGPLFLIVRNPYGAWAPAPETMSAVASACAGVFAEAWLVNHREGALDASPPEPRLVQIAGFS